MISTDRRFIEPDGKGNHNVVVCKLKNYFCVNISYLFINLLRQIEQGMSQSAVHHLFFNGSGLNYVIAVDQHNDNDDQDDNYNDIDDDHNLSDDGAGDC